MNEMIEEFNLIRSENYSEYRTLKCNKFVSKFVSFLDKENLYFSSKELDIMLEGSVGEQLLCIIGLKYSKNIMFDLVRIFKFLAVKKPCLYLQYIAREIIMYIINNNMLNMEEFYELRHYLGMDLGFEKNVENISFLEFLSELVFVKYCKVLREIQYKKNEKMFGTIDNIRLRACMCGMALGDALGFLVEGQTREVCFDYVNNVIKKNLVGIYSVHRDFGQKGGSRYCKSSNPESYFEFGQYTDDTQCAREFFRSIIETKGVFDGDNYGKRIVTLFDKSCLLKNVKQIHDKNTTGIVGYGTTTRYSAQNISNGVSWELAASRISQGNGACMRSGPIGALFFNQPEKIGQLASSQAMVTHANFRCKSTSVMIAEAVRLACEHSIVTCISYDISKYPDVFCNRLSDSVRSYDNELASFINKIPGLLKDQDSLLKNVVEIGVLLGDKKWHDGKVISASTVQSSIYALCCFLTYSGSYMDAICMAIEGGGDTDTVAAMCGSISGAYTKHFELDLLNIVNDQGKWKVPELCKLCDCALELVNRI